jgi:hypothetical protein
LIIFLQQQINKNDDYYKDKTKHCLFLPFSLLGKKITALSAQGTIIIIMDSS